MTDQPSGVSKAFQAFLEQAPKHSRAWMGAVRELEAASSLDKKTAELAYLAVLAALRMESGVPFHVKLAKEAGASRDDVISAVLARSRRCVPARNLTALPRGGSLSTRRP